MLADFVTRHSEINEVSGLDPSPVRGRHPEDRRWIAPDGPSLGLHQGQLLEPCIIVPAVTEVCLPHAAHSKVKALAPPREHRVSIGQLRRQSTSPVSATAAR